MVWVTVVEERGEVRNKVVVEEEDLDKVLVVKWEDEPIAVSVLYYNLL